MNSMNNMNAGHLLFLALLMGAAVQDLRSRRAPLVWALLAVGIGLGVREDPVRTLMSALALMPAFGPPPALYYLLFFLHPASFLLLPASRRTARREWGVADLAALCAVGMAFPWPVVLSAVLALEAYRLLRALRPAGELLPGIPALAFGAATAGAGGPATLLATGGLWLAAAVRLGAVREEEVYRPAGRFGGLLFWPGSLTLLAGAPGAGKTSWALRMAAEAAERLPAAFACYEHTAEEMAFRLRAMARRLGRNPGAWERLLLLELSDREDTPRALEEILLEEGFPERGPAFLAVDYLQRMPVYGHEGLISEARRGGEAAAALRAIARRRGWIVVAVSAVRREAFEGTPGLEALLGDERIAYEADRAVWLREGAAEVLKDRTGPLRSLPARFEGEHFLVAVEDPWASKGS